MYKTKLLLSIFFLSIIVAAAHLYALQNFLYWKILWFDLAMHFAGGVLIGLCVVWVFLRIVWYKHGVLEETIPSFWVVLLFVSLIGVGWEVFEYYAKFLQMSNYLTDTVTDLLMDLLGGAVAYVITRVGWLG